MNSRHHRLGRSTLPTLALALVALGCAGAPDDPGAPPACGPEDTCASEGSEAEALIVSGSKQRWQRTAPFQEVQKLQNTLSALDGSNTPILGMTASASGAWVITTQNGYYTGGTLPGNMPFWLSMMKSNGETLRAVDINSQDGWVIIGSASYKIGGSVNQLAKDKIAQYYANGWVIRDVDVSTNGYVILGEGNLVSYDNTGEVLTQVLADRVRSKRRVEQVEIGLDGGWVVVSDQESATAAMPAIVRGSLAAAARNQAHISKLMLGPSDGFVLYSHGSVTPTPGNVMEAIEYGQPGGQNLWERMSSVGVPGMSIAIIQNNQVVYARGYGVLKQGEDEPVLATTPFDMASLSKMIGALTMVKLDADPNYDFDLDDSVKDSAVPGGIVDSWIQKAEDDPGSFGFPAQDLSSQLTIAHFLRHQTDFVPSNGSPGFDINTQGEWDATVLRLLRGWDCFGGCGYNQNNFAWTAGGAGPVATSYDSVNFLVPQAVLEDVTGKEAYQLLGEYFFQPMGLTNISGYNSSYLTNRAAWQHGPNGPVARRQVYPWTFAGGIYAAPMDYAELMILVLNQGKDSSGVQRLPASAVNRMLDIQAGSVGFGLFADVNTDITERNDVAFRHSGSHPGQARTYMCGNPTRNAGIVVAFNADIPDTDSDGVNETIELRNYIMQQYSAAVGWSGDCL